MRGVEHIPGISDDDIRAADRLLRHGRHLHHRAVAKLPCCAARSREHLPVDRVRLWRRHGHRHPALAARNHQVVQHVIGVADPGELQGRLGAVGGGKVAREGFLEGEHVCEGLQGVVGVGEGVDDGDAGGGGEGEDVVVRADAGD